MTTDTPLVLYLLQCFFNLPLSHFRLKHTARDVNGPFSQVFFFLHHIQTLKLKTALHRNYPTRVERTSQVITTPVMAMIVDAFSLSCPIMAMPMRGDTF